MKIPEPNAGDSENVSMEKSIQVQVHYEYTCTYNTCANTKNDSLYVLSATK